MIRNLHYLGDPILRKKCVRVETITSEVRALAQDLIDSMLAHNGSGLAAPQIGFNMAIFVVGISDVNDEYGYPLDHAPTVFINPEVTVLSEEREIESEGCLSIPGFLAPVERPKRIKVSAMDLEGKIFEEEIENWRARCVQHETDHLHGILHIDRMSDSLKKKHEKEIKTLEMHLSKKTGFKGDPFLM